MTLPDLAARILGGAVIACNDEFFAAAANLNAPHEPEHRPLTFDERGQVYDGWETRRRREPGEDWAVLQLGAPGLLDRVVVDTAHFRGNYPESCTVDAACLPGYPTVAEVLDADWETVVPTAKLRGHDTHEFTVADQRRFTHVRLRIHPDGGVARMRVYGEPMPDPGLVGLLPFDLAAVANGARVLECSDDFFSPASNMLLPDSARVTGEGWETGRRRDDGYDWAVIRLAASGRIALAEVDTRPFIGNAPAGFVLRDATSGTELLPFTELRPNTVHRFGLAETPRASDVRLEIVPDGGVGRLRLYGAVDPEALSSWEQRWAAAHRPR